MNQLRESLVCLYVRKSEFEFTLACTAARSYDIHARTSTAERNTVFTDLLLSAFAFFSPFVHTHTLALYLLFSTLSSQTIRENPLSFMFCIYSMEAALSEQLYFCSFHTSYIMGAASNNKRTWWYYYYNMSRATQRHNNNIYKKIIHFFPFQILISMLFLFEYSRLHLFAWLFVFVITISINNNFIRCVYIFLQLNILNYTAFCFAPISSAEFVFVFWFGFFLFNLNIENNSWKWWWFPTLQFQSEKETLFFKFDDLRLNFDDLRLALQQMCLICI